MYKIAIFEKLYIDFNLGINYDFVLVAIYTSAKMEYVITTTILS